MLKLYRRPRDKVWKIRGSVRGVRYEESTGYADKEAAQQILNARAAELDKRHIEAAVLGRAPAPMFAQAVVDYLRDGKPQRFIEPLLDLFGETPIDRITQEAVDAAARRLHPNASGATRNRQVYTPVSAILQHSGVTTTFRRPKAGPQKTTRALTSEEAALLVEASAPHLRPLIIFLLYTGARIGEALWLDWQHVSLERAHVTFPTTKTGRARGLPLHRDVIAALSTLEHKSGAIFRRPDGKPYEQKSETDFDDTSAGTRIKSAFKAAVRRAGLGDLRVHDLRHTWATWHVEQNHDLLALMNAGGWTSLKMVERYAHKNRDEFRAHIDNFQSLNVATGAKQG
jgi:integrase